MREVLAAFALTAGSILPNVDEYKEAAHQPTPECKKEVEANLRRIGMTVVDAVAIDASLAVEASPPTSRDNNRKAKGEDIDHLPDAAEYLKNGWLIEQTVLLRSGLVFNLYGNIGSSWSIDPEVTDEVISKVLEHRDHDNPLRSEVYRCLNDELFQRRSLDSYQFDIAIWGEGEHCLVRQRVGIRGVDVCTAAGKHQSRHSPNRIIIAPGLASGDTELEASSIFMHEIFHGVTNALKTEPAEKLLREFGAYGFQEIARAIMEEENLRPMKNSSLDFSG